MPLPVPKNMMLQSGGRSLSIDFFTDEEVQQILREISEKITTDTRRSDKHKRYFLLVQPGGKEMMSCRVSCDRDMTSQLKAESATSNGENVMWRRLLSYYYIHMIQEGFSGRTPALFIYRS